MMMMMMMIMMMMIIIIIINRAFFCGRCESEGVLEETNNIEGLYRNTKIPWTFSATVEMQTGAAG